MASRKAHNLEIAGSIPAPAILGVKQLAGQRGLGAARRSREAEAVTTSISTDSETKSWIEYTEDGCVIHFDPPIVIPEDEAEWEESLSRSLKQIENDEGRKFDTSEEFLRHLEA